MNKVLVTGNLVKDIDLKYTPSGVEVTSNTIAVKRERKNENDEYETDFINFVAWKSQAKYLKDFAKKGDHLEIVGRWQVRKYDDNGTIKTVNELIVESLALHSSKKTETESTEKSDSESTSYEDARKILKNEIDNSDLPF